MPSLSSFYASERVFFVVAEEFNEQLLFRSNIESPLQQPLIFENNRQDSGNNGGSRQLLEHISLSPLSPIFKGGNDPGESPF